MATDACDGHLAERREPISSGQDADETPVGVEFSVRGICSPSLCRAFVQPVPDDSPLRPLRPFDGCPVDLDSEQREALNMTFLDGAKASATAARTGDPDQAKEAGIDVGRIATLPPAAPRRGKELRWRGGPTSH